MEGKKNEQRSPTEVEIAQVRLERLFENHTLTPRQNSLLTTMNMMLQWFKKDEDIEFETLVQAILHDK